jgi:hypothetical protein
MKTKPLLRLVAGTSDYTFQFDSLPERDAVVDAFTQAGVELACSLVAGGLIASHSKDRHA